jgi:hypothetical protein
MKLPEGFKLELANDNKTVQWNLYYKDVLVKFWPVYLDEPPKRFLRELKHGYEYLTADANTLATNLQQADDYCRSLNMEFVKE